MEVFSQVKTLVDISVKKRGKNLASINLKSLEIGKGLSKYISYAYTFNDSEWD